MKPGGPAPRSAAAAIQKLRAHTHLWYLISACVLLAAAAAATATPSRILESAGSSAAAVVSNGTSQQPEAQDDIMRQHKLDGGAHATKQYVKALADRHFNSYGAKWPSHAFVAAVREASIQIHAAAAGGEAGSVPHPGAGGGSPVKDPPNMLVLMAMANDLALQETVPAFVESLAAVKLDAGELAAGGGGGRQGAAVKLGQGGGSSTLADHLLLACSSETAAEKCRGLGLGSRCVVDDDMALGSKSLPFHSIGFNMIGFAKVKYILNALSLGRAVIFLDTDVVVFRNFIPYVMSMGADVAATVEKCKVIDDKVNYGGRPIKGFPMFNIGVTYFRSSPGVLRCVYSWLYDMWMEVAERPRVWDQDVFRKVMFHCTKSSRIRLHAFSPRHLNSYCYKPCGCDYSEEDIRTKVDAHLRPVRAGVNGTCPRPLMDRWLLMHFPCAGETLSKASLMQRFRQGEVAV